jgi:DNA-binding transcriptional regulator YiaG
MTKNQFRKILAELHLSQMALARLFMRGERTVRRWALGSTPIPPEASFLLRALKAGKLTVKDVEGYHD